LGVGRECTDAEIKKAYRRESLKHHPDKVGPALRSLSNFAYKGCTGR
jgi:DnaJ-class molecular chaperone